MAAKKESNKKRSLSIREARQALGRLEEILDKRGEVTITRRGEAIAKVVPIKMRQPAPDHRELRTQMRRMKRGSEALLREERDAR